MNLGTIAFEKEVFNLDLMSSNEIQKLLIRVEDEEIKTQKEIKKFLK